MERPGGAPRWHKVLTPVFLRREYVERGRTVGEIAALAGCSETAVLWHMDKAGIPRRRSRWDSLLTAEFLRREYVERQRTTPEIAADLSCSEATVHRYLVTHGIPRRPSGSKPGGGGRKRGRKRADSGKPSPGRGPTLGSVLTREFLEREYVKRSRSMRSIAREVGCHAGSVAYYRDRYGLTR